MTKNDNRYAYVNDELLPIAKAFVHVSDLAIHRGYGIFDFFKIQDGHPFFLDDYLQRFYQSASLMQLKVPHQPEVLKSMIFRQAKLNSWPSYGPTDFFHRWPHEGSGVSSSNIAAAAEDVCPP